MGYHPYMVNSSTDTKPVELRVLNTTNEEALPLVQVDESQGGPRVQQTLSRRVSSKCAELSARFMSEENENCRIFLKSVAIAVPVSGLIIGFFVLMYYHLFEVGFTGSILGVIVLLLLVIGGISVHEDVKDCCSGFQRQLDYERL